jgi:hypothetical protein
MNLFRVKQEPATEIDFGAVADNGKIGTEKPAAT